MNQEPTHEYSAAHSRHHETGSLRTVFFLNLSFTIIEIIGGLLTNSLAVLSDALHDLGDSFTLGLSWYLEKVSRKGRSFRFSYGYRRFSLLGAFANGIVLFSGSVLIVARAIPRLYNPESVHTPGLLGLALLGIVVNGIAVLKMQGGHKLNEKVVMLHLLEDVLGWGVVLIGGILMLVFDLPIIDPVLSIGIAVFILWKNFSSLIQVVKIFLQSTPDTIFVNELEQHIKMVKFVIDVHDTHVWSLDGQYHVGTIHLVVSDELSLSQIIDVKKNVRGAFEAQGIEHCTIEVETEDEVCSLIGC